MFTVLSVAVFSELRTFIQCVFIPMNVPHPITAQYKRGVGGRPVGDRKHFFKRCVILGLPCDLNEICALLGCYVAYSQAHELDP